MPDYTSPADQRAAEQQANFMQQLAAINQQRMRGDQELSQVAAQGEQAKQLAQQKSVLQDQLNAQEMARNQQMAEYIKSQIHPGDTMTVGTGTVSLAKKDPSLQQNRMAEQKERDLDRLVKTVRNEYDNKTKTSVEVLNRSRSIADALERGDIATLGQVKANLPGVEGEKYRPTDRERQDMISATAQGSLDKLKNYFLGDNTQLSDTQRKAFANLVRHKADVEEQRLGQVKKEVLRGYGGRLQRLAPHEQEDVAASMGMASKDFLDAVRQEHAGKATDMRVGASPAQQNPPSGQPGALNPPSSPPALKPGSTYRQKSTGKMFQIDQNGNPQEIK